MTKREDVIIFLKSIRRKRHELQTLRESAAELRSMLLPSGIRYDKEKVQASHDEKLSKVVGELMEIETQQEKLASRLRSDIVLAEKLIEGMPSSECRELIRLRYLSGGPAPMTWVQVADKLGYSPDHIRGKLHGKAIKEIREVWKKNTPEHK